MLAVIVAMTLALAAGAPAAAQKSMWALPSAGDKAPYGPAMQPTLIGHRGGHCDKVPEHSVASYMLGFEYGVEVSECDVCWSKDLVPICRHEPYLSATTDAMDVYPDMVVTKNVDGRNITDVFAEDLTLAQLKALRLNQKTNQPNRTHMYDGELQIVTFEEHVQMVMAYPRTIAIIPELKHSTYFNNLAIFKDANTTTMQELLKALARNGYDLQSPYNSPAWRKAPFFIQSFEQNDLVYITSVTCSPVVQLCDGPGSFTVDRQIPFDALTSDASLDSIAMYATVFGPWKNTLAAPPADDRYGLPVSTGLCERAQNRNLIVQPYTFRPEDNQMAPGFYGIYFDEFDFYVREIGIDGIWTDSVPSVEEWYQTEMLMGRGWNINTLARLNQVQAQCKRPHAEDVELAKMQYPNLSYNMPYDM